MKTAVILSLFLATFAIPTYAGSPQERPLPIQSCSNETQFVRPQPRINVICRTGYVSYYNPDSKIPDLVIYTNNRFKLGGCVTRSNNFQRDLSVPNGVNPSAYTGTGFDRGHMAPDDDMRYSPVTEDQSFIMTNMTPQLPGFNRGVWKKLEGYSRDLSYQTGNLTIISGAIYSAPAHRMNGVVVPNGFYKILIDPTTKTTRTFIIYQNDKSKNLASYLHKVSDVAKLTGQQFVLLGYHEQYIYDEPVNMPQRRC